MKTEVSKTKLYDSFSAYLDLVKSQLRTKDIEKTKSLHADISYWLRISVERVEVSSQFQNLVSVASLPRTNLQNFFRRSKLYLNVFKNEPENLEGYFERLWTAFSEKSVKITSLRLLGEVDFHDSIIDFENFRIQRFSKTELDDLFDNQINHVFYPYAELDTSKLSGFWFIREESLIEKSILKPTLIDLNLEGFTKVTRAFPDKTIQLLSLCDWENLQQYSSDLKEDFGWFGFSLQMSFRIIDDIFESPRRSPDLSVLAFKPFCDSEGEEIGEEAELGIHVLKEELVRFKGIVKDSQSFLYNIDLKKCDWEFIDRAMGYLAKAFLSDGLEQLLWHITVLEVLLVSKNEKDTGITSNIRRRLGIIFGKSDKQTIKDIYKSLNELYDFRSELVHGGAFVKEKKKPKEVYLGHLRKARKFARRTLYWYIETLSFLHTELTKKSIPLEKYPKQEDLLFSIDFQLNSLKGEFGDIPIYTRLTGDTIVF